MYTLSTDANVITTLVVNIADALIAGAFLNGYMGSLYSGKKKYLGYALFAILYAFTIVLISFANMHSILSDVAAVTIPLPMIIILTYLYSLFFTKGNPLQKILPLLIFFLLVMITNATISFAASAIIDKFSNVPLHSEIAQPLSSLDILILVIDKIILFYITQGVIKLMNKDDNLIKPKEWVTIFLSPIISIIIMTLFLPLIYNIDSFGLTICIFLIIVLLFASSLITYYLYVRTIKNNKLALQYERMKQQQEYEKRHYEDQTKKYDDIRTIWHNMKNQLIFLKTAIKEGRSGDAVAFINKLTQDIENTGDYIRTDNYAFNCILNVMITKAKECDIRVKVQITEHIDSNLNPADVSVILGNLLENAIDACNKLDKEQRKIGVTIEHSLLGLMIQIGNSVGASVLKENPSFLTDKPHKEQHGLGVKSVRKLVEKYDGLMTCHEKDNIFFWTILFKKGADLV